MMPKIIVADDSTAIQKVVKIAFATFSREVAIVHNFGELKQRLTADKWDLVIADANLPGLTSKEDFTELEALVEKCPFIFLSGSYDSFDVSILEDSQLNYHIMRKPFDASELINIVKLNLPKNLITQINHDKEEHLSPAHVVAPEKSVSKPRLGGDSKQFPIINDEDTEQVETENSPTFPPVAIHADRKGIPAFVDLRKEQKNKENQRKDKEAYSASEQLRHAIDTKQHMDSSPAGKDILPSLTPKNELITLVEEIVKSQLEIYSKDLIITYCQKHFKNLAEEVIIKEIEKLLLEKNKLNSRL